MLSRRTAILALSSAALCPAAAAQESQRTLIRLSRDASCGCCKLWAEHLEAAGFAVEITDQPNMSIVKSRLGVPTDLASCHTAQVGGYVIEGHVPASAIERLLASKEPATGLAVPRMPTGSPGMESGDPNAYPAYNVILFGPSQRRTFARYRGTQLL
jgi:hypothetical protein